MKKYNVGILLTKSEAFPDLPMGLVYLLYVCPDALYYNAALTLSILQKLGVASEIFHLWFLLLQQVKKSGMRANFKREHEKKVCCLGLTSLLALRSDQLPAEALGRVFRANLDLLVAYKDQIAEAAKEEEAEEDDDMDGFQTDDEDEDGSGFDKEMGVDADDGDDTDTITLRKLADQDVQDGYSSSSSFVQAKSFRPNDLDDDDSDDDYSDDEVLQSPIDEVDPFVFFVDTIKTCRAEKGRNRKGKARELGFDHEEFAVLKCLEICATKPPLTMGKGDALRNCGVSTFSSKVPILAKTVFSPLPLLPFFLSRAPFMVTIYVPTVFMFHGYEFCNIYRLSHRQVCRVANCFIGNFW
ncbi:hypothetical protein V8G54_022149 [Vigna mungo]|uniref:Uncharacterized protein n=1 Tax=Vigna mungo TaxID=3915 RepID=A0AAQ3NHG0_VIGMU